MLTDSNTSHRLCVAPMIDWTDRHCRYFHRFLSPHARLYTEMIVDQAILRGDRDYLLGFHPVEHPVALQLGGSDPRTMAAASQIGAAMGYDEININVGCPSDRVQAGTIGACLMRTPETVAACFAAMQAAVDVPVTVKCRIGVDDQVPEEVLPAFMEALMAAGCRTFVIHARKAWLHGLSPKENRNVPPLDYPLVLGMKARFPEAQVILNGGLTSVAAVGEVIGHVNGVMIGRAAYENPWLLTALEQSLFDHEMEMTRGEVVDAMARYTDDWVSAGGKAHHVTRHMIGLFQGQPGARRWRQLLSAEGPRSGATGDVLRRAADALPSDSLGRAA